jgi:prepilin-type N-terminal cleavage/methylation domain-containing protein
MKSPTQFDKRPSGFSLVEVTITIAIAGVMAGIAISAFGNITKSAKISVAQNVVETLNDATKQFGHAQYKIVSAAENTDSTDEVQILHTLQWKDPSIEFGTGGPFMKTEWIPLTSNSNEDYRAVWAGSYWKLVQPGETGAGLKINFEGTDLGVHVDLGANFEPVNFEEE